MMPSAPLPTGKLPAQPARPQLKGARFLDTAQLPDPPDAIDWMSGIRSWPMYANDRLGDCVFAGIGHQEQQISSLGQGAEVRVTDDDVVGGYSTVTGYNPGDPSTDQGTYVQDAMAWWRKTGIAGHQILSYASIDPADTRLIKQCVKLFGAVGVGFNFPDSAWQQFADERPWDVVPVAAPDGGHYVMVGAYDPSYWNVVTWGAEQLMTPAFWTKYVDECWVVIDDEMADKLTGRAFSGVDLYTLGQDFSALTREPSPIPAPGPPVEIERATAVDRRLDEKLGGWPNRRSVCGRPIRKALNEWRSAKNWT